MKRFYSFKGILGLGLVGIVILIGVLAPLLIAPELGTKMYMTARLSGPSFAHPFGTDQLGRDLFVRVMLGTRTSLEIAVTAVGMSIVLGLPLGMDPEGRAVVSPYLGVLLS